MRMHEWMKYRDRQIRRALRQADDDTTPLQAEELPAPIPAPTADDTGTAVSGGSRPPTATTVTAPIAEVVELPEEMPTVPTTQQEVLDSVAPSGHEMRVRLEALLARQGQLPLDIAAQPAPPTGEARRVGETRDELVERLLDPTLTLQETSLLLGVCPTTVRRYTNRGALRCMRTPGNQRRFRLSDILDFMEHRENWA